MVKQFDGLDYTREAILEELTLVERHARDGSAVEAGCSCIEEKHLLTLAGLASEGVTLASDPAEKEYYMNLASLCREKRQEILNGAFKKKGSHVVSCEEKVLNCIEKGLSEDECRRKVNCQK